MTPDPVQRLARRAASALSDLGLTDEAAELLGQVIAVATTDDPSAKHVARRLGMRHQLLNSRCAYAKIATPKRLLMAYQLAVAAACLAGGLSVDVTTDRLRMRCKTQLYRMIRQQGHVTARELAALDPEDALRRFVALVADDAPRWGTFRPL